VNILVPHNLHIQLSYATQRNSEKTREVCDVTTHGQRSRRESEGFVWHQLRATSFTFGDPTSHLRQASELQPTEASDVITCPPTSKQAASGR
jgi:hypothetical protein